MKLMINHQTHYQYSEPVTNSMQYIRMMPSTNPHQQVLHWNISVPGVQQHAVDGFANQWLSVSQHDRYQQLLIMAQGVVEIDPNSVYGIHGCMSPAVFLQKTHATGCSPEMLDFAHRYVPDLQLEHLHTLAAAVLNWMPYQSDSTLVTHTAIESFAARQGVCQDHSHVYIAMCKAMGVPARYVSGYLYAQHQLHLASHAWAEIYLDGQWHVIDASNQLFSPNSHVYVAIGRDYWDVAPVRGVRSQGGMESMHSIVQVLACA